MSDPQSAALIAAEQRAKPERHASLSRNAAARRWRPELLRRALRLLARQSGAAQCGEVRDSPLGQGGVATISVPGFRHSSVDEVVLQSDGKIVLLETAVSEVADEVLLVVAGRIVPLELLD